MVWAHHAQALNSSDAHNEDKCECKNYLGPVRLIIYQSVYDRTPLLNVVIMPKNPRRESPDGYVAAELELCTANGIYSEAVVQKIPANLNEVYESLGST
jgi:hypothetical protein